jgi:4-oxalomesaconate hydratase
MHILVFSAHSADFCSRAGGTIAKYARMGAEVRVVSLSYGERSESGGLYAEASVPTLEQIKAIRREEALRAAQILGATIGFLDWGDLRFEYTQERARLLGEEIRSFRPDAILTHHGPDSQSVDHDTTAHLVQRACQLCGAPGLESAYPPTRRAPLFYFEATVPLTELEGFDPDVYVDVTDVWDTKLQALRAFERSQGFLVDWYTDQARLRAFQARRLSGRADIVYAEAFERTSPWVGDALPLNA